MGDVVALVSVIVLFCACLEIGSAHYFGRLSQMENRRQSEYRSALGIRQSRDRQRTSALVVGNSLLLEGVDFPQLKQAVGPEIEARRLVVENTSYLDWYYGLRHLFRRGAQPDVVVLVLNPIQLTSAAFDGDYSAHFLVDRDDLRSFVRDIGADRNTASSLALANISSFYGSRAEIRSWILGKTLPGLTGLFRSSPKVPQGGTFRELATQRLAQLHQLCAGHGAELVLVLPPARRDAGVGVVLQAAADNEVQVLLPIAPGVLSASYFADNFHLNSVGAAMFTPALAAGLKQAVAQTAEPKEAAAVHGPVTSKVDKLAVRDTASQRFTEASRVAR